MGLWTRIANAYRLLTERRETARWRKSWELDFERGRERDRLLREAVEREVANGATVHCENQFMDVTSGGDDVRHRQRTGIELTVIRTDGTRLRNFGSELVEAP